jgi:hypothetical protein
LLLGIVEGVGVEEGPDKLAADVFEAEFERGVLEDGVVAAVEGGGADVEALLVGDFFGSDEMVGVAGAGGGDGGVKRMREGVAESDAERILLAGWRARLRTCGIEWPRWEVILHGCGVGGRRKSEVNSRERWPEKALLRRRFYRSSPRHFYTSFRRRRNRRICCNCWTF